MRGSRHPETTNDPLEGRQTREVTTGAEPVTSEPAAASEPAAGTEPVAARTEPAATGAEPTGARTEPAAAGVEPATTPRTTTYGGAADPAAGAAVSPYAIPRTRGAMTGFVVFVLGLWGAIVPFIGPYFHYAYINYNGFALPTMGRIWLSVLPGALAMIGGLELMRTAHRGSATMAAIAVGIAGGWFIAGPAVSMLWNSGVPQTGPALGGTGLRTIEWLGYFYVLGGVLVWLGGTAFGRFTVRSVRDERAMMTRDARA